MKERRRDELSPEEWFAKLRCEAVDDVDTQEFMEWLEAGEDRGDKYVHCETIWALAATPELADDTHIQQYLKEADDIIAEHQRSESVSWWKLGGVFNRYLQVAATIGVIVVATLFTLSNPSDPKTYTTAVGEQRTVVLADGSRIILNTSTTVSVDYTNSRRLIGISKGQAMFDVVNETGRPFEVHAYTGVVRAIGTLFSVAIFEGEVAVVVLEGKVGVNPAKKEASDKTQVLTAAKQVSAGEGVRYWGNGSISQVETLDIEQSTAWTRGELDFTDMRLSDAIAEFNRYTKVRFVLGHNELGDLRIGGIYRIGDRESLLFSLNKLFGIEAEERHDVVVLLKGESSTSAPNTPSKE